MKQIIDRTEVIAMEYLTGLGFDKEQVVPLIAQARQDLESEFAKLDTIRHASAPDPVALDRSLHAIKGLLFNLGYNDLAEKLEAIRAEDDVTQMLQDLEKVLAEELAKG